MHLIISIKFIDEVVHKFDTSDDHGSGKHFDDSSLFTSFFYASMYDFMSRYGTIKG